MAERAGQALGAGAARGLIVIKVGGSLAETGRLADALAIMARATRPVVVVPGGGQFADKVRDLQNALRFDDRSAHRLAMLGMHQMAEIYFGLESRLAPADSLDGIARVLATGQVPVWLPLQMCQSDPLIPADWSITSDGLAARLAELLGGAPLALLKSVSVPAGTSAEALAADDVVDAAFPGIVARGGLAFEIIGPDDGGRLAALVGYVPAAAANS